MRKLESSDDSDMIEAVALSLVGEGEPSREENEAHIKKTGGRTFGDYDRPEDLFHYFDPAQFYCWIAGKNEEATKTLENRNC